MRTLICLLVAIIANAADRPNVLFVAVDDLRPELATYGKALHTPNFDRLAASGMRFDRAYCQQAVCGASRLSIMGGLYPTKTKEQTFHVEGWRKRHPDLLTLNQHFRQQGYQTLGIGKIYHGSSGPGVDVANWDRWLFVKAPYYATPKAAALLQASRRKGTDKPKGPSTEEADVSDDTYVDGLRAEEAAKHLRQLARSKKPFFFAVGLTKPHLPFVAPKRYWDLYKREDFAMPANAGIPPGYPVYAANAKAGELRAYADIAGRDPKAFPDALNKRLLHGYAACVSYTDANLGRILDALDETGLARNTIVVLWGDHGWKLGDHSSWCKHTNFECDTRVPLLVRVPGKPAGKSTSRLVELIDLYPTLCELADIAIPAHCQGRSFAKVLADPEAGHRRSAYSSYPAKNRELGHSIRFSRYRYTEWHTGGTRSDKRVLTDLVADPGEETNVIKNPEYANALAEAEQLLMERIRDALK
jgi:iduronate 2-sulfatase